ncbi:GDSL-type esterase/lipase family protein [Actinomycetospora straminea]|uniref:SGNH hydrolase-type esterase domain-containing protein n=1 Tax=Actinomycetospora straminea TaxID=663607 RepID=A0ABP9EPF6_9PSEU|nr:GDSL-type esterase/lipase family protein [Actinomycetospora straminea]MDD7935445.1 GDSL-type esterase/lipase family protein [Actinomycetospora straminea]
MGCRSVVVAALVATVVSTALTLGAGAAGAANAAFAALPAGSPASGGDGNRRVALGDSWAAGTAAGAVEAASGTCRRSGVAYPPLLARAAAETSWTSRACSSSTGGGNGQFTSLTATTEVVTATVGADATGLGALAAACSAAGTPARCDTALARFDRALRTLPGALDAALRDIRARAPRAAVTVTGYPHLAEGGACPKGPADAARAARIDGAVDRLDTVLAERVTAAGLRFVDVRPAFAGHGVCSAAPWLTSLTDSEALLAGGPNADGHARGVLTALAAAGPTTPPTAPPTPASPADGRVAAGLFPG